MINYIKNKSNLPDLSSLFYYFSSFFIWFTRGLTVLKLDSGTQEEVWIFLLLTISPLQLSWHICQCLQAPAPNGQAPHGPSSTRWLQPRALPPPGANLHGDLPTQVGFFALPK